MSLSPLLLAAGFAACSGYALASPLPAVLSADTGAAPTQQVRNYLQSEVAASWSRWKEAYEARTDPAAIAAHEAVLRQHILAAIGGLPQRTPLQARTVGILQRDGYRVEKVIFESQPRFYVTASLFLPDSPTYRPPYPGVLVCVGHYPLGKADPWHQSMGALLALNGMAGLVFDPIEEGERLQFIDAQGHSPYTSTTAHTLDDVQAQLFGQSIARCFIWDGMRGIDYLQSRPEIDPSRIGVTGNSGGGTQTSYLVSLDGRVKAAAPSCSVSNLPSQISGGGGDGEQNIRGALSFGLDQPDYLFMRAPTPIKILSATHDFVNIAAAWESFRLAKRVFTRLGVSERIDLLENDAGHNYNRTQREAAARWMARWLEGRDVEIHEPTLKLCSEDELFCTPRGQVMLVPGARSIHDLMREEAGRAATERSRSWAAMNAEQRRTTVRRLAQFHAAADLPPAGWTKAWTRTQVGYRVEAWRVRTSDGAVLIPALWLEPDQPDRKPAVVYVSARGFAPEEDRLAELARSGRRVLALDVRGTGETETADKPNQLSTIVAPEWSNYYSAYLLGRTYLGMQTEDILAAATEAGRRTGERPVELLAVGGVAAPALHAAFSDPQMFEHVTLEHSISSWDQVVRADQSYRQLITVVFGALRTYDLPDLAAGLRGKVTIVGPVTPLGQAENP